MPAGRPRKPTERKRATGNPGKRKLPARKHAELVPAGFPGPPKALGDVGRGVWCELWSAGQSWLSPSTDVHFLTLICEAFDTRALVKTALEGEPIFGSTDKGFTFVHPGYAALRNIDAQIAKWLGLCGFTPSDRSRLGLSEVKRQSKLEALLAQRAADKRGAAKRS